MDRLKLSQAELADKVLLILRGDPEPSSSSSILQTAREKWQVGDLEVREAIWGLLESHQVELTADRRLRAR